MAKWGLALYSFKSAYSDHLRDQKNNMEQTYWFGDQGRKPAPFLLVLQTTEDRWVEFLYSGFLVLATYSWPVAPTKWCKQTIFWTCWSPASLSDLHVPVFIFKSGHVGSTSLAKQQKLIELALIPLVSLVHSSILPFLSKPVPGSNAHNLSYGASGVDLLCRFSGTKLAKGSLSVSFMAHRVPSWIAIKWEPPVPWAFPVLWTQGKQVAQPCSPRGIGTSQGPLGGWPLGCAHCHVRWAMQVNMWCGALWTRAVCQPSEKTEALISQLKRGKAKTFGSWPCWSTHISLAKWDV